MRGLLNRLLNRLRHRHFDDDLREELLSHEEMKREALRVAGWSEDAARVEARRALGNTTLMREDARRIWVFPWIDSLMQDARYAIRSLVAQPLHATTSIATAIFIASVRL